MPRLLAAVTRVVDAAPDPRSEAVALARHVMAELRSPPGLPDLPDRDTGRVPPVRAHIDDAVRHAETEADPVAELARTVAALATRIPWERRRDSSKDAGRFHDAHADALVVGPGAPIDRDDVALGLSLLGPHVQYPDHSHAPEEVYVVLTRGEWRRERRPWNEHGPGDLVHTPPAVEHSMRSGAVPLLAIWLLRIEG